MLINYRRRRRHASRDTQHRRTMRTFVLLAAFFSVQSLSPSSLCHDTIPFSIKLARSPLVVTGDLIDVATLSFVNNHTKPFNMTLLIRCIFKGQSPADERIIIEHTPPGNRNE